MKKTFISISIIMSTLLLISCGKNLNVPDPAATPATLTRTPSYSPTYSCTAIDTAAETVTQTGTPSPADTAALTLTVTGTPQATCTLSETGTFTATVTETTYIPCDYWYPPENMGSGINTEYMEYNPYIMRDYLLFSAQRAIGYGGLDIWVSYKNCASTCYWTGGDNNLPAINSAKNERGPFPVIYYPYGNPPYDPRIAVLYYTDNWGADYDIYYAVSKTAAAIPEFFSPAPMPTPVNSGADDMYFWLSPDGNTGYLCSKRTSAYFDIYSVTKTAGAWCNEPVKLGSNVNTGSYSEECPFLNAAMDKLYFTSNRYGGRGGYDIYVSYWSGTDWGPALNVCEVNTQYNEYRPSLGFDTLEENLYFSSDRPGGYGSYDLYRAQKRP